MTFLLSSEAERPRRAPAGPVDSSRTPRYAGPDTFARLPRTDQVAHADIAVIGVPFDSGVSYRPGARFAPTAVREASRSLRPHHPGLDVSPSAEVQVADGGDIAVNPFNIGEAIETQHGAEEPPDPAYAPGTGTPEAGGQTSRELPEILRGLRDTDLVCADVVEVAPAYDHAETTSVAASHTAYDLISLMALQQAGAAGIPSGETQP